MEFVKLRDLCEFEKGSTGLASAEPGSYPLVTTGAERKSCATYQFDTKAVCIPLVSSTGHGHASLKNVHYQEGKFALGSILVALTCKDEAKLEMQFLHLYLSQLKDQILVPLMSGAANVSLSVKKIQDVEILLPPIHRQREVVQRFKSIVEEENELNCELASQQALLNRLRQQILQEALEGKLTVEWRAQITAPEFAGELLKGMDAERAELRKDEEIEAQKLRPSICDGQKPFDLPTRWEWMKIDQFLDYSRRGMITGPFGSALQKSEHKSSGIPVWGIESIKNSRFTFKNKIFVTEDKARELSSFDAVSGDILISRSGTIDEVCVIPSDVEDGLISTNLFRVSISSHIVDPQYFCFLFKGCTPVLEQLKLLCSGSTRLFLNQKILKTLLFPVPPIAEQEVIIAKGKKLFALCDQLENQIDENQTHAKQLMQVVLKEAFSHDHAGISAVGNQLDAIYH